MAPLSFPLRVLLTIAVALSSLSVVDAKCTKGLTATPTATDATANLVARTVLPASDNKYYTGLLVEVGTKPFTDTRKHAPTKKPKPTKKASHKKPTKKPSKKTTKKAPKKKTSTKKHHATKKSKPTKKSTIVNVAAAKKPTTTKKATTAKPTSTKKVTTTKRITTTKKPITTTTKSTSTVVVITTPSATPSVTPLPSFPTEYTLVNYARFANKWIKKYGDIPYDPNVAVGPTGNKTVKNWGINPGNFSDLFHTKCKNTVGPLGLHHHYDIRDNGDSTAWVYCQGVYKEPNFGGYFAQVKKGVTYVPYNSTCPTGPRFDYTNIIEKLQINYTLPYGTLVPTPGCIPPNNVPQDLEPLKAQWAGYFH